ncbi:MAG: hypothetical protein RL021_306, partial [Bacteroidota bacterium]
MKNANLFILKLFNFIAMKQMTVSYYLKRILVLSVVTGIFSACNKDQDDNPVPTNGVVRFQFSNVVGSAPVQLGQLIYTNAAGNLWQADLLKYYISNATLVRADSSGFNTQNYDLIDEELPESKSFQSNSIPNGTYTSLRFLVGVDSARNNDLDQAGDLDPSYGMFWPWNTGYIFYKHEGYFQDSAGALQPLLFHYGTDLSLVTVELPVNLTVKGDRKTIAIAFDLQ